MTSRGRKPSPTDGEPAGLGLGVFIAKTLLERSGATLALANQGRRKPAPWSGYGGVAPISSVRWGAA